MDQLNEKHTLILESALETVDGLIITDVKNRIIYLNKKYAEIMNISVADAIGKNVKNIIPQTRMDIVAKTGQEEIGSVHFINNNTPVVCNRIPIKKDEKILGVVAMTTFKKLDETKRLSQQVEKLTSELQFYKSELGKLQEKVEYSLNQVVGNSFQMKQVKDRVSKVASSTLTVLINGETGTGKEVLANAIHQLSLRQEKSFIRINCAAIPRELLESELFGYEEGAFTGARKGGKLGKFEIANGGTLLLDEINELPLYLQSKLLRIIQEKEFERVGGLKTIKLDVRLICTSNKDLLKLVQSGDFRQDLYYRINVVEILIPPLRERVEDIKPLVNHFIKKVNFNYGLDILGIDEEVIVLFKRYSWPGNIRELEHVIEQAAVITKTGQLKKEHFEYLFSRIFLSNNLIDSENQTLEYAREMAEAQAIIRVLAKTKGNKTLAAEELKIHRTALYEKIKKYNIQL